MKIELKKWSLDDKKSLSEVCSRVDRTYLSNQLPSPYTEDSASWWLNMACEQEGHSGIFRSINVDGKIVGNISVEQKSDVYQKDAEIGYLLTTENWSRGIMTEAVRQICDIAFAKLDIIRITALVYEPNTASRKVLLKNQFVLEGIMKRAVWKDGHIYDLCVYGRLKDPL